MYPKLSSPRQLLETGIFLFDEAFLLAHNVTFKTSSQLLLQAQVIGVAGMVVSGMATVGQILLGLVK